VDQRIYSRGEASLIDDFTVKEAFAEFCAGAQLHAWQFASHAEWNELVLLIKRGEVGEI